MKLKILSIVLLLSVNMPFHAQNVGNPVLKGIADAGCIRYAGKYYLGGVATYGDFFVSSDMVNWNNRIHVFDLDNQWTHGTGAKNNQVHADDISYSGGLFHLLFSVNYWGQDKHIVHITHATSPNIEGPYKEVRDDQWYENRIDPQIFQDEDGSLYLYMVKFTDGNTIWARPLNDDFSFAGDALQQFSSQPGTWETLDNRVAEGPFVIKYRNRYYMMYNANHTAPEFGNYHLGVCEAPSPLMFNPGGKYSHPVVGPNTEPIGEKYTDLLRYGSKGYNNINLNNKEIHFMLDSIPAGNLFMLMAQRGGVSLLLNGKAINPGNTAEYAYFKIDQSQLKVGDNIITLEKAQNTEETKQRRNASVDHLYLYATGDEIPDEVLVTPGQPNIVRGPNGWEWWLVYMANQGWKRHQFVDRIHFVNDRMTVDGITSKATSGFHPTPAKPQYEGVSLEELSESLVGSFLIEITSKRNNIPEEWRIERNDDMTTVWKNKVLVRNHESVNASQFKDILCEASGDEIVYVSFCEGFDEYGPYFHTWMNDIAMAEKTTDGIWMPTSEPVWGTTPADDYSFSAEFTNSEPDKGQYGVMAAYQDEKNYVRITIDAEKQSLITEQMVKGRTTFTETPLAETRVHYPDIKYTDSFEKQYRFDCETFVSSVEYPHLDASHDGYAANLSIKESDRVYREDMAGIMTLEYLDAITNQWIPLSYTETASDNAAWQKVTFSPVRTKAIRMINKDPRQNDRNIYKVKTCRDFEANNQLRIEKRDTDIHIFVGQRELQTIRLKKSAPSRVGLFSNAGESVKVSNTLYYIVK